MTTRPQTLASTSAFEVLGPIMVGPSSSHTAGALRCARVAASLLEGDVTSVRFTLWNSFSHTYRGHGTDRALVAGILGLDTDDERIRDAFALADERGLEYGFDEAGDDSALHPNTVDIDMAGSDGTRCVVRGESLGGGRMRVSRINDIDVDITGAYSTLFVSHRDVPGALASLTGLLAHEQVNIAFCRTYRTEQGGRAYTVFETDAIPCADALLAVRALPCVLSATLISVPGSAGATTPGLSVRDLFDDGAQLLAACDELGRSIGGVMRLREERLTGERAACAQMLRVLRIMQEETSEPLRDPQRSLGGFLGGEARDVARGGQGRLGECLMGAVQTDAVARAMAVLERSASMGVIVAAPTAGSAGVVPGCVLAVADHLGSDDEEVCDALFAAAAVGLDIQTHACVAGAEGGCQAEVGSASAMAAAAVVQLMGGTPECALHASSIAIGNLLGLVCDPVGGLVEVPCQARNAIGVANAFSAAQLALSGVTSLVPFDEAVQALSEVGHALPDSLRETAKGGLAASPTARAACARCAGCQ